MFEVTRVERTAIALLLLTIAVAYFKYRHQDKRVFDPQTERKLHALLYAQQFEGRQFPAGHFRNIMDSTAMALSAERPTPALIFSLDACDACLSDEIEALQRIHKAQRQNRNLEILAIALNSDPIQLAALKKTRMSFPLLYDEAEIISRWTQTDVLPIVLLIGEQRGILQAHIPVAGDKHLIDEFYACLDRFLE